MLLDVSAQKQIPYSLEKALLHLVNFLHPKCSTFLRVPLIQKVLMQQRIVLFSPLTPSHQYPYSPYSSLYVSISLDKEKFVLPSKLLRLAIISFILVILMNDSAVLLQR